MDGIGVAGRVGQWDLVATVVLVGDGRVGSDYGFTQVIGLRVGEKDGLAAVVWLFLIRDCEVLKVLRW